MDRWPVRTVDLSNPVAILGGTLGVVLITAIGRAAPVVGLPALRLDVAIGGWWLLFIVHAVVIPMAIALTWRFLPGIASTWWAIVRAILWTVALSIVWGIVVTLAFGFDLALLATLIAGELLFSLSVALVGIMPRGLSPVDALGWMWTSHGGGETP